MLILKILEILEGFENLVKQNDDFYNASNISRQITFAIIRISEADIWFKSDLLQKIKKSAQ